MSVHRKETRWVVRWRQEDRQRSRSFPTKRDAVDFDRAMRADERRNRDSELAGDLLARARVLADDHPDPLRRLAEQARTLADEADRRADEVQGR